MSRPVAAESFAWGAGPEFATVDAVRRAAAAADGLSPLDEAALLELKHHGVSRSRLLLDGEDGFALVRDGQLDLVVAPWARRHGVGRALLEAALPLGVTRVWSHGDHPAGAAFARHFGFERARELWVMRRSLADLPPLAGADGVRIRHFEAGDEDDVLRINGAAFAHHPEQASMDAANFGERTAEPWFRAEDLLLAVADDGRVLGFHWTKRHDEDHGEVYVVAVSPDASGRGLGRLLTLAGLHHLARAGLSDVLLYVDATNTPAVRLYESLGFTHTAADTHVEYART